MLRLRAYRDSDYPALRRLLRESGLFSGLDSRANLRAMRRGSVILALDRGALAGCVYCTYDGWVAFIFHLAVRKSHRGIGIGSRLMAEAERRLRERGAREASLFVWERAAAVPFYQKLGYRPVTRKRYCFLHKRLA